jgi:hypothetical protein
MRSWILIRNRFLPPPYPIEALLVDEEAADQVWEAWNDQTLNDEAACIAWMYIGFIRNRDPFVT